MPCTHIGAVVIDCRRINSGDWLVLRRCPRCRMEWSSTEDEPPDEDK